jgi:hypothetical protein
MVNVAHPTSLDRFGSDGLEPVLSWFLSKATGQFNCDVVEISRGGSAASRLTVWARPADPRLVIPLIPGVVGVEVLGIGRLLVDWSWAIDELDPSLVGVEGDFLRRGLTAAVSEAIYAYTPDASESHDLGAAWLAYTSGNGTAMDFLVRYLTFALRNQVDLMRDVLLPHVAARLCGFQLALVFDERILREVVVAPPPATGTNPAPPAASLPPSPPLGYSGTRVEVGTVDLVFSGRSLALDGSTALTIPRSWVGSTGMTIEATGAKAKLDPDEVWSELVGLGLPGGERGVYIPWASIGLPENWTPKQPGGIALGVERAFVGTGGFTGSIRLFEPFDEKTGPVLASGKIWEGDYGGFAIELRKAEIDLLANGLERCDIEGSLTLPSIGGGAPLAIDVAIGINGDGGFSVTARTPAGGASIGELALGQLGRLSITSVAVGRAAGGRVYLDVSGRLRVAALAPGGSGFEVALDQLRVFADGSISLLGGVSVLVEPKPLRVGPVSLDVSALTVGSYVGAGALPAIRYLYVSFDGALSTGVGGVDARGSGVKVHCPIDWVPDPLSAGGRRLPEPSDVFITIEGLEIAIRLPADASDEDALLILKGYISKSVDPLWGDVYKGGIAFSLPRVGVAGRGEMVLVPDRPAWAVDVEMELAQPIPIAPNVGIYGLRGMIGRNLLASKVAAKVPESATWWEYYKAPVRGVNLEKMDPEHPGFMVGLGASIATAADSGKAFSSKVFLYLGLPVPFLLQGQATVNDQRLGLDDATEAPFQALIAIDDRSILANLSLDYLSPSSGPARGQVLKLNALAEVAFYLNDPTAWHVHVGTSTHPVQAKLIRLGADPAAAYLFDAYAYLMLNHFGVRMGAGASHKLERTFSVSKKKAKNVGVSLRASVQLDWAARFAWGAPPQADPRPRPQFGASVSLAGQASVKVLCIRLGIGLRAVLAAEGPKPFQIAGKACVWIQTPFKDFEICVDFSWVIDRTRDLSAIDVLDLTDLVAKVPAIARSIATGEAFGVALRRSRAEVEGVLDAEPNAFVVPLDSSIDIEFAKPMASTAAGLSLTSGVENREQMPPQRGLSVPLTHAYRVTDVRFLHRDDSGWRPYDPYDAILPAGTSATSAAAKALGFWQLSAPKRMTKLSLLAQTPLAYANSGAKPLAIETLGHDAHDLLCGPQVRPRTCAHLEPELDEIGWAAGAGTSLLRHDLTITMESGVGSVLDLAGSGHDRGFAVWGPDAVAVLTFPAEVVEVDLAFAAFMDGTVIEFQRLVAGGYETVGSQTVGASTSPATVRYADPAAPIARIRVSFDGTCKGSAGVIEAYTADGRDGDGGDGDGGDGDGGDGDRGDGDRGNEAAPNSSAEEEGTGGRGGDRTVGDGVVAGPSGGGSPGVEDESDGGGDPVGGGGAGDGDGPLVGGSDESPAGSGGSRATDGGDPEAPTSSEGPVAMGANPPVPAGTPTPPGVEPASTGPGHPGAAMTPEAEAHDPGVTRMQQQPDPAGSTQASPLGTPLPAPQPASPSVSGAPDGSAGATPPREPAPPDAIGSRGSSGFPVDGSAGSPPGLTIASLRGTLPLGDSTGAPVVVHEVTWLGGSVEFDGLAAVDEPIETGVVMEAAGATVRIESGPASICRVPGPAHQRGIAAWSPGGVVNVTLTQAQPYLVVDLAAVCDGIVEFQAADGFEWVTVERREVSLEASPAQLTYSSSTRSVQRIRVSAAGAGAATDAAFHRYLDRVGRPGEPEPPR